MRLLARNIARQERLDLSRRLQPGAALSILKTSGHVHGVRYKVRVTRKPS
jgi:hypothetical protein